MFDIRSSPRIIKDILLARINNPKDKVSPRKILISIEKAFLTFLFLVFL